jgi:hypothetical protein
MNTMFQQNRLACVSFLFLVASWLLLWSLISSGMNSRGDTWVVKAWVYSSLLAAPIAALIAIAGIVLDRRKPAAVAALLLSLLSTLVVLSIGG